MAKNRYSKSFRLQVAREAIRPENRGLEHLIAEKYGVQQWTVERWRDHLLEVGEVKAFTKGFTKTDKRTNYEKQLEKENAALREEVEILKKAAAFLANVKRD